MAQHTPPATESVPVSDNALAGIAWSDLFNTLWPGAHAIRTPGQIKAFEASVRDRVSNLKPGDIARALQTLSERQRSRDETVWKGVPGPSQVVSQIIRLRYETYRSPDEVQTEREQRINALRRRIREAPNHRTRWDIICDAGDLANGGTEQDCIELHGWTCRQWMDFPVDVLGCRKAFDGGVDVQFARRPA